MTEAGISYTLPPHRVLESSSSGAARPLRPQEVGLQHSNGRMGQRVSASAGLTEASRDSLVNSTAFEKQDLEAVVAAASMQQFL